MFGLFKKNHKRSDQSSAEEPASDRNTNKNINFSPDRPIHLDEEDRLGFRLVAENLATSVLSSSTREGLVIGIEGSWGSGKSSILNLLCSHIENKVADATIIRFDPWVVGDRDNMVAALINSLALEVAKVEDKKRIPTDKVKGALSLSKKLRKYGATAGRGLSPLAKLATILPIPYANYAETVTEALANIDKPDEQPLSELKNDLVVGLRRLNHRFIIVVDDIDRLEPTEAAEIVRLIRAVGDFPNVVYLLCYDKDVLAKSLISALKVEDGKAFLQKIVQVSFAVPRPEEFDLRRWLLKDCHELHKAITGDELSPEIAERLNFVCDSQGGNLQTPREIGLVLNSLRLVYPPVANRIDFADLCWLQIIRIKNEGFYKWIEKYLAIYAAIADGASLASQELQNMTKELCDLLGIFKEGEDEDEMHAFRTLSQLEDYLPGIKTGSIRRQQNREQEQIIYNSVSDDEKSRFEQDHRLGSAQHYRLYFAFSQPSGALDDGVLTTILMKAENNQDVQEDLERLININRPQGGTVYELFLNRFKRQNFNKLSPASVSRIFKAIGDTIDTAQHKEREVSFFGIRTLYRDGRDIFKFALKQLEDNARVTFIKDTFENRKSIGWLLAELIGDDLFAHGRAGDKQKSNRHVLTENELNDAIKIIFDRLAGPDRPHIETLPQSLVFFHRWNQAGGGEDMKKWMEDYSKTDEGFLELLHKCRGWMASDKVYHPLNERDLSQFMNFDEAVLRLKAIAKNTSSESHRKSAEELLKAIRIGERRLEEV